MGTESTNYIVTILWSFGHFGPFLAPSHCLCLYENRGRILFCLILFSHFHLSRMRRSARVAATARCLRRLSKTETEKTSTESNESKTATETETGIFFFFFFFIFHCCFAHFSLLFGLIFFFFLGVCVAMKEKGSTIKKILYGENYDENETGMFLHKFC